MRQTDHSEDSKDGPGDQLPYVGTHKHVCCFYRTHQEMERMWVPFILEGLRQRQKCMVVVGTNYSVEEAINAITGIDVRQYLDHGALVVVDNKGFPTSPKVKAAEVIAFWRERLALACNEGYESVRVAAQMTWLTDAQRECDVVPEYEFLCNKLFPQLPISAICMYDTVIFSQQQLNRVTAAHPYVARQDMASINNLVSNRDFLLSQALQASINQQSSATQGEYEHAVRLLASQHYAESEHLYRNVVATEQGLLKVSAMLGLIESLRGQGRNAEADSLEDQATALLIGR